MKAIASDVDLVSVQLYNFGPSPVSDLPGTVKTMQSVVDALGGDASKAVAGLIISEADFPRYNVPTGEQACGTASALQAAFGKQNVNVMMWQIGKDADGSWSTTVASCLGVVPPPPTPSPSPPPGPSPSPPSPGSCTSCFCGKDWSDANTRCGTGCPDGTDAGCGDGEKCFSKLPNCHAPTPPPAPGSCTDCWCGDSWADANTQCGTPCPSMADGDCNGGQKCFGSITGC